MGAVLATLIEAKPPDFRQAGKYFATMWGGRAAKLVTSDHKAFCKKWWQTFEKTKDVQDAPRSGRPRKISKADGQQVAENLKQGRWVKAGGTWRGEQVLVGYTSMQDALKHCPIIKHIRDKYDCTGRDLWRAAHDCDPDLGRRRVWAQHKFSDAELAARSEFAEQQLTMLSKVPNYLDLLVFADESSTVIHGRSHTQCRST